MSRITYRNRRTDRKLSVGRRALMCAAASAGLAGMANFAPAQSATWTFNGGGSWNDASAWLGGVPATGSGNGAVFNGLNLTSDYTITLDTDQTIGTLSFNDTIASGHGWILNPGTPGGSLNLSVASGSPNIDVNGNTALTVNAIVTSTQGLSRTGNGTLVLNATNQITGTGTLHGDGIVVIGANDALGTGTTVWGFGGSNNGLGTLIVTGGAKTLSNNLTVSADWLRIAGSSSLTLNGTVSNIRFQNAIANDLAGSAALTFSTIALSGETATRGLVLIGEGNNILNGPVTPGAASAGVGTLFMAGSGTTTINNAVSNSVGVTVANGTTIFNVNAGASVGSLSVGGLAREASKTTRSTVVFNGAASASTLSLGGNLNINSGDSKIIINGNAGLALASAGTFARGGNGNGVLDLTGLGSTGTITIGTGGMQNGTLPYVTVNEADFAAVSGGAVTAFTSYTDVAGSLPNDVTITSRILGTSSANISVGSGTNVVNGILVKDAAAHQINLNTGTALQIGSPVGAILMAPGAGSLTIGSAVNAGTLSAGGGTTSGTRDLLLINNSTNDMTINSVVGNLAGSSTALVKSGTGRVVLKGTNTYNQNTYVNGGTLVMGSAGALGSGTVLRVWGGGVLDTNGFNLSQAEFVGPGMVTNSGAAANFTFAPTANRTVYGQIAGNLRFIKTGAFQVEMKSLTGNSYTGGTVLSDGSIRFGHGGVLGTGSLIFDADPTLAVSSGRGMFWSPGTLISPLIANDLHVNSGRAGTIRSEGLAQAAPIFTGDLTGAGTLAFSSHPNIGAPIYWSADASAFTGTLLFTTAIANNTTGTNTQPVIFKTSASSAPNAFWQMTSGGSTGGGLPSKALRWQGTTDGTLQMGALASTILTPGTNSSIVNDSPGTTLTLEIGNLGLDTTFQGNISDGSGNTAVRKVGSGTLTFTGNNTYTGTTVVDNGVLWATTALGNTPITVNAGTLFLGAGAGTAATTLNGGNLVVSNSTLNATSVAVNGGAVLRGVGAATVGNAASTGVSVLGGSTAGTRGTISLVDSSINTLSITAAPGAALTLGGSTAGERAALSFELGSGGSADKIQLTDPTATAVINTGGVTVNVAAFGAWSGPGNYTLINAPGGGIDQTRFAIGDTPVGFYGYSFASSTANDLILSITGAAMPDTAYWKGDVDASWTGGGASNTNWATDSAGATDTLQLPGGNSNVVFIAAGAANLNTTLNTNLGIKSLRFASGGAVTIGGTGRLAIGGDGLTVDSGSAAHTLNVSTISLDANQTWTNNSNSLLTVNSTITGPGGVTIAGGGSGPILLTANNTYTGGTTINTSGIVRLGNGNALGSGILTMNGGVLDLNNLNLTVGALAGSSGTILNNAAGTGTLTFNVPAGSGASSSATIANGTGAAAVVKTGSGSVELTGANTYTGGTTIAGGLLRVANDGALGGSTSPVNLNGGTLQSAGGITFHASRPFVAGVSGGVIDTTGFDIQIAGPISGTGAIGLASGGKLTLSGDNSGFGGVITTNSTNLTLASNNALASGTLILSNGSTLDLNGQTANGVIQIPSGGTIGGLHATITNTNLSQTAVISGTSASGGLIQLQSSFWRIAGDGDIEINTFWQANTSDTANRGLIKYGNGVLTLGGGPDTPMNSNNQTVLQVGSFNAGAFNFDAGGTVIVNKSSAVAANTLRFALVNDGTLKFGANTIDAGSTGQINAFTLNGRGVLDLNGASGINSTIGILSVGTFANNPSQGSFSGIVDFGNGTILNSSLNAGTLTFGANNSGNAGSVSTGVNTSVFTGNVIDGTVVGGGTLALVKIGSGTMTFATNTAGSFGTGTTLMTITGSNGNTFSGGLYVNGGTFSTLSNNAVGTGTIQIGPSGNFVATGVAGGGLTLDAANPNQKVINNGNFFGTLTAPSGKSVGGSGIYNGAVTIQSGGIVAPGASVGVMTAASTIALDTANLAFEIGNGSIDRLNVSTAGALSAANVSTFNLLDTGPTAPGTYTVIDYTGSYSGSLANFAVGTTTVGRYTVSGLIDNVANTSIDITILAATPVTSQWGVDQSGNWSVSPNWIGSQPGLTGDTANFGAIITAPQTVTVDAARTVGTMNFDNANSYTIAGANAITMDVSSGDAGINVLAGSHAISAPVTLSDGLVVNSAAGAGVAFTGSVTAAGMNVTKAGAGTAQFANVRAASLAVNGGSVAVAAKGTANDPAGTSVVNSLSIASGASLDLTNNSMVIDYTTVGTLVDDTRQHLAAGRLTTSAATPAGAKLGYADNAVLGLASFAGQTVDATSLLVKFTYAGDTNLDGQVDITDLGNLATNWQTAGVWTAGDSDYSGFIDITDLGALATNWQAGVGNPLGPSFNEALAAVGLGGVSVPEPASMGLLATGLIGILSRRRRP